MTKPRDFLDDLTDAALSVKLPGGEMVTLRFPDSVETQPMQEAVAVGKPEGAGASDWLLDLACECAALVVTGTRKRSRAEWRKVMLATRPPGELLSPIAAGALRVCGFIVPDQEAVRDNIAEFDEAIGEVPT